LKKLQEESNLPLSILPPAMQIGEILALPSLTLWAKAVVTITTA
jgi:hypothetical protein